MNALDIAIVIIYIVFLLGMGYFFKNNNNAKEYFLGGRNIGWFPLSLSTMATQLSAISFISAPAFVGLKLNGGLKWLTFEFAVPIAMAFILLFVIPPLFRSGVVSIYEFIERRFATSTRLILSIVFQISKALGTGVMVYTVALILQAILDINYIYTVAIISVITIAYSLQGGMKAVVWGDAIQMILLFLGLLVCLCYGWNLIQDHGGLAQGFDPERLQVIDFNMGLGKGEEYGIWPMLIGGFFLYVSYYGCDQTQAQRLLAAKDENTIKKLLLANGLLRFPVVLVYCIMGLFVGALLTLDPDFMKEIGQITQNHFPEEYASLGYKADLMIPVFITRYLPHGFIGILMVAILSAAMSSLSSTVNSLSAVSVEDFFNTGKEKLSTKKYMKLSKIAVFFWGLVCIGSSFLFGGGGTVIEIINAIGSVFYGPVLVTFILAIFSKRVNHIGMNTGIITAVAINFGLTATGQSLLANVFGVSINLTVFWIWLNFTGVVIALIVAYGISFATSKIAIKEDTGISFRVKRKELLSKEVLILVSFFVLLLIIGAYLPKLF